MRKGGVAEWVVKLAAGPERGAAIYGDLVELAGRRGDAWFRRAYARTVVALTWRTAAAFLSGIAFFDLLDRSTGGDAGLTLWVVAMVSPAIANIAVALLLVIPYSTVRYGPRDRMVRLAWLVFVPNVIAASYVSVSFVFAFLIVVSVVALCSKSWRAPAAALIGTVVAGAALSARFDGALGWHAATAATLVITMIVCSGLRKRLLVATAGAR